MKPRDIGPSFFVSRNFVMVSGLLKSFAAALLAVAGVRAAANQLVQVTADIGPNPNNVGMFVYKPTKLASPTPLIVAIHYCSGTAQAYFQGSKFAQLSETYGYVVLFPSSVSLLFPVHSAPHCSRTPNTPSRTPAPAGTSPPTRR